MRLCEESDAPPVCYFNNLLNKGGNSNFKMFSNNGGVKLCPQSRGVKLVNDCKSVAIRSVFTFRFLAFIGPCIVISFL